MHLILGCSTLLHCGVWGSLKLWKPLPHCGTELKNLIHFWFPQAYVIYYWPKSIVLCPVFEYTLIPHTVVDQRLQIVHKTFNF